MPPTISPQKKVVFLFEIYRKIQEQNLITELLEDPCLKSPWQSIPRLTIPNPRATPGDSHILVAPGVGFSLLCLAQGSAPRMS